MRDPFFDDDMDYELDMETGDWHIAEPIGSMQIGPDLVETMQTEASQFIDDMVTIYDPGNDDFSI